MRSQSYNCEPAQANVYMNFVKIMRYLTKLHNSDISETFSRLPAVSISLGDTNSVTVKSKLKLIKASVHF